MVWKAMLAAAACAAAMTARGADAPTAQKTSEPPAGPRTVLELPPGPGNPRNSEGDFARLKNGDVLYVYSRYDKGHGDDADPASLASRVSRDGGRTWSAEDVEVVPNEGKLNVMSVSLLRMGDGSLGLFYLRKNSGADCRPVMRRSRDEGRTWSAPQLCVPDSEIGFYVLNNSRVVRLSSGRIVLPLCWHTPKGGDAFDGAGLLTCVVSDDDGATWRRAGAPFATTAADGRRVTTQEPGVVELKDGRALMFARTTEGRQWSWISADGCATWTDGGPWTLAGPCSPATVKRLSGGELVAVWNDHETHPEYAKQGPAWARGARRPLTIALSRDEGRTWSPRRTVEDVPKGWYCYTALLELDGNLLLGYCAEKMLCHSRVTLVPLAWLRGGGTPVNSPPPGP